ncbi:20263_t:CDS:2, partial [Funneliformis geosporum]
KMPTEFKLPVIDLSAFTTNLNSQVAKLETARQIHEACRDVGFFYLTGHNVPQDIIDKVLKLGYEFFHLPEEEKIKYSIANEDYARGYQRLGENVTKYQKDWHEALDFYRPIPRMHPLVLNNLPLRGENQWPENPAEFRSIFNEYINFMLRLGVQVMSAIALGLGLEEDFFEKFLNESFWVMRVIGYPDLRSDSTKGALQVQRKDGTWINAEPIQGALVVNIGDMLNVWSNNVYQSTLHRVIHQGDNYRVSVPFFYEPNFDAKIEPLEPCLKLDPVRHHEPVVYGEHLLKKVSTNFEVTEL